MTLTDSQVFWPQLGQIAAGYIGNLNGTSPLAINSTNYTWMGNAPLYGGGTVGMTRLNTSMNPGIFNTGTTYDLVTFINNLYTKILDYPDTSSIPPEAYDPSNPASPLYGLYQNYLYILGNNPDLNIIHMSNLPAQFSALFSDCMKNFSFSVLANDHNVPPGITVVVNGTSYQVFNSVSLSQSNNYVNFYTQILSYMTSTTSIQNSFKDFFLNPDSFTNNNTVPQSTQYIQSYQAIYEAFNGPVGTLSTDPASWTVAQQVFVQRFSAFYGSELQQTATSAHPNGYFDPSQALADWYNYTQNLYYNPQYTPNAVTMDPDSTIVLDEVLQLIIDMIGTIQTVAAAQSNQLNFLSQWQESYTNKLNQMHTFAQGDGTVLDGSNSWNDKASQQVRNDLNNVNQNYISKLQANQQTISDTSKSMQTTVNQSNDAANQQASMADSILQEMSTIISAIFK